MTVKLAINGFGRIGRGVLRALCESGRDDLDVVAINDLAPLETNAHLFEFDSVHGRFRGEVTVQGGTLDVGRGAMRVTSERAPDALPWEDVDIVLECTGVFRTPEAAGLHLKNGARKVLISAPGKGDVKTIVYGVNHGELEAADTIVSNASCTTNCLAPVAHVLHGAYGIKRGHMTTVHAYTASQSLHDRAHKSLTRARAAALSMIPTTTGAARTLGKVLPALDGRISGTALRVPVPNVSCVDLCVELEKEVSAEDVNALFHKAAQDMKGVLDVCERQLVSADFNHDPHSAIVDLNATNVQGGNLLRVLVWYDNEWGFSNRMLDTAAAMARA